jgi:hypothetical protein
MTAVASLYEASSEAHPIALCEIAPSPSATTQRLLGVLCVSVLVLSLGAMQATATPRGLVPPRPAVGRRDSSQSVDQSSDAASAVPAMHDAVGRPGTDCQPGQDLLAYHGGALVLRPDVFVIFWGNEWTTDAEHLAAAQSILALYQQLGSSAYACAWHEYEVPGMVYGDGTFNGFEIISSAPPNPLPDSSIQARILTEVAAGRAPSVSSDRVYVVVPSKGTVVRTPDGSTGCGGTNFAFCGYHDSFGVSPSARVRYAVLPYPCSTPEGTCFADSSENPTPAFETVGSHELTELVTDPDGDGWGSDRTQSENADICRASACDFFLTIGAQTFRVNSTWSNAAKGCIATVPCAAPPVACTDKLPGNCVAGSSAGRECALEWLVYPNLTQHVTGLPGNVISCADGDAFCDFDGVADGTCTFHVGACLNSDDPRVSCTPGAITSLTVSQPSTTSRNPAAAASAAALLDALVVADPGSSGTRSKGRIAYAPAAASPNACTGYIDITVATRSGGRSGKQKVSVSLKTSNGRARNPLTLVCLPPS